MSDFSDVQLLTW